MASQLEADFEIEMRAIHRRAVNLFGYAPNGLLRKIRNRGAVGAAKHLLEGGPENESSGLSELVRRGGIDGISLSVEQLVLNQRFASLFTAQELRVAALRLSRLVGELVP